MKIFAALRRAIVRASPTCTLWVEQLHEDVFRFRFHRRWVVTRREFVEASR